MFSARLRGLLLVAAVGISMLTAANPARSGAGLGPVELHREAVDERGYPWSSIGKLYNETGGACSGVVIAPDKILTAAHCLFNYRTQLFIPPAALHFLVGYRSGRYSAHARIVSYETGAGFDPLRYGETSDADWAVLTVTERLPAEIEPLRLTRTRAPSGTKAILAGYPQDRAFAMTADRDCELRDISAGRLMHTCRGIKGYSGAPILVFAGGDEMQVAGIQIATLQSDGATEMIAVPAQMIGRGHHEEAPSATNSGGAAGEACDAVATSQNAVSLPTVRVRLAIDDFVSPATEPHAPSGADTMAWLASDPFAVVVP